MNSIAIAAKRIENTFENISIPFSPASFEIGRARERVRNIEITTRAIAGKTVIKPNWFARITAVVIAPGPVRRGTATTTIFISRFLSGSLFEKSIPKNEIMELISKRTPPATMNAGMDIAMSSINGGPMSTNMERTIVAMAVAIIAEWNFWESVCFFVRDKNTGRDANGSMMMKRASADLMSASMSIISE